MKGKILITLEVLIAFVVFLAVRLAMRSTSLVQWEKQNLGWIYSVMFAWIAITVLVILLLVSGQVSSVMYFSVGVVFLLGLVIWLLDGLLIWLGSRSLQRGRLLTGTV